MKLTKPISLDSLERCLIVIAKKFIILKDETPEDYARRVINQNILDAKNFFDIKSCTNSIAVEACQNLTIDNL